MNSKIRVLAESYRRIAIDLLGEAIRIPADHVARSGGEGGDPQCGLSNHEGPRLEYLHRQILELGAVDHDSDVGFDRFGNLWWSVEDPADGIPRSQKTVVYLDGHTDTVQALRPRWHEAIGGGIDAYLGLTDPEKVDRDFLRRELGHLPPDDEWRHLLWGRGSADQLGGVVCQILATRLLRELRSEGSLSGVIVRCYATVAEEDNDGGGPMFYMKDRAGGESPQEVPDVVILTEGTGCAHRGALGIYRGQRGRLQIEVEVTGKSCHGSMPWEGRNPLEHGGRILAEAADAHARGQGFADDEFLGPGSRTASWSTLETPSDCAVPERFVFRFDRRLTAGEDPEQAVRDIEALPAVGRARREGLEVEVRIPVYDQNTWRGFQPGNQQIYPGWVTPPDHPAISAAADTYRSVVTPMIPEDGTKGGFRREPRVSRWIFSTDGVGVPVRHDDMEFSIPSSKQWISSGPYHYPAMFGFGPGIEQNTHKIGESVDTRELAPVIAFLARFPSLYRQAVQETPE